MHTINGILHPKKPIYSWWGELSEQWTAIHRRYARIMTNDAAYWYTERTNVGVLAQAAWACGLVALEEYQAKKAASLEGDDPRSGRCDLWLANGRQGHFIEAKQRYLHLRSNKMTEIINDCLERAYDDAVATRESEGEHGIGLAFFPIYVPVRSIEPEEISSELLISKLTQPHERRAAGTAQPEKPLVRVARGPRADRICG